MTDDEAAEVWELANGWVSHEVLTWLSSKLGDEAAAEDHTAEADYYYNELRMFLGMEPVDTLGISEMQVAADKAARQDEDMDAEIRALLDNEGDN